MKVNKLILLSLICLPLSFEVRPSIEDYYPRKLEPTYSNYGITGILEMPNARLMEEGSMRIGYSNSYPYEYTYISATPFSWLEASYKYTEEKNELYGPSSYSGNQTLKDKGFDIKIRLLKESYYIPEIAIGWNDLAGTGRFAGEHLTASKKIKNVDFTVGLGWGRLGQDKNIRNPFIGIDDNFRFRQKEDDEGGAFNSREWFSGDEISFFQA